MIEIIGCIFIVIIGISFICIIIDELRTNYKMRKWYKEITGGKDERIPYTNEYVDKLLNQQNEFINYLENMLDDENDIFSVVRVKDVLQKYKSIIGVLDEESNNISS